MIRQRSTLRVQQDPNSVSRNRITLTGYLAGTSLTALRITGGWVFMEALESPRWLDSISGPRQQTTIGP